MKPRVQRLLDFFRRYKIVAGLLIILGVALLLTCISVYLYTNSGVSQLDLSRPGYERVREEVQPKTAEERFDPDGPVDNESIDTIRRLLDNESAELKNSGSFEPEVLSDEALHLTPDSPGPNPY